MKGASISCSIRVSNTVEDSVTISDTSGNTYHQSYGIVSSDTNFFSDGINTILEASVALQEKQMYMLVKLMILLEKQMYMLVKLIILLKQLMLIQKDPLNLKKKLQDKIENYKENLMLIILCKNSILL